MSKQSQESHDRFDMKTKLGRFTSYGYFLGAVLPALGVKVADELTGVNLVASNYEVRFAWAVYCFVPISVLLVYAWRIYEEKRTTAEILLRIVGGLSLFTLHLFVSSTGGSTNSLFVGYYLYIPTVVVIIFGKGLSFTLIVGAIFSLGSFAWNIFAPPTHTAEWAAISGSTAYKFSYVAIYLLQLFTALKIVLASRDLARP